MIDLEQIEKLIREGKLREGGNLLRKTRPADVGRSEMQRFANLARRAGLPHVSVRTLNPIARPDRDLGRRASEGELAEYAAALTVILVAISFYLTKLIKKEEK